MAARLFGWFCAISVFAIVPLPAVAQPLVAPSEALSPEEQQKKFHLPPGFEIQLVAAEPEIAKPMNIAFDNQGRLWVSDTLEYPYPATGDAVPRDTVKILVDKNGDGRADEITTFVDGLNIPLGVLPMPGGAICYDIGKITLCVDSDNDGKADRRDVLYSNFGSRDTHGMVNSFTRGLDGWIYACHGFANDSAPQGKDGHAIKMNSGNTFRFRASGQRVEYFTHGQVNPFGLAFDPLGNLYSADCHTMPVYTLLRGAYYPSFGKAHDGLDFGPTMIGHLHGSTGIGGIAYYAAEHFPREYRDTLLIGNPVTGRVNHDRLKQHGSTYDCVELEDFIRCDDLWFRPVNLIVGPDGALYVADFYNCIIGHYEVPLEHPRRDRTRGRIWRVVYTGKGVEKPEKTAPAVAPRIHDVPLDALVALLGDGNLSVRTFATHEIVDRIGAAAVEPLRELLRSPSASARQRVHGMWALERIGGLDRPLVERLAQDDDRHVRTHLMKLLAEREWTDEPLVLAGVTDADPFVRRAAADALARHPRAANIAPLVKLWAETPAKDTHLVHVARMALRDQLLPPGTYAQLHALLADPENVKRLANVSLGVKNEESAAFILERLKAGELGEQRDLYLHDATRYVAAGRLPEVYAFAQGVTNVDALAQAGLVRAVGQGTQERGLPLPEQLAEWSKRICGELLAAGDEGHVRAGIELARDFRPAVFEQLALAARQEAKHPNLRGPAMDACTNYGAGTALPVLATVLVNGAEPLNLRQHAAGAIARLNDEAAREQLMLSLQTAPEGLALAIAAALADSVPGANQLLAAVAAGKASARLLQEANVVNRLRARRLENFDEQLSKLTAGLPPADQRIKELIHQRGELLANAQPDAAQGAALYEKHCAVCHRIGDKGAKIGPNLDGVGIRGRDRLLEDILDPSRNVDQAFRATQIVTADGQSIVGLALREEGEILVLADAQGKEVRVPTADIDQRATSSLSIMPANVADLVSESDFVHLIGYLLAQRIAAEK